VGRATILIGGRDIHISGRWMGAVVSRAHSAAPIWLRAWVIGLPYLMDSHLFALDMPHKKSAGQLPQSFTPPQPSGIEPHSA
jgi:hypothetical protein